MACAQQMEVSDCFRTLDSDKMECDNPDADTFTYNENPSFSTIGRPHLDFYGGVTRQTPDDRITELAKHCISDDLRLSILTFFQKRDCREGAGERKPFILAMAQLPTKLRYMLYPNIPKYGYWDDLNALARAIPEDRIFIVTTFAHKLFQNIKALSTDSDKYDLNLEKWLPTEGQCDDREWQATKLIREAFNQLLPSPLILRPKIVARLEREKEKLSNKYDHLLKKAQALPYQLKRLDPSGYRKWCSFARAYHSVIEHYKSTGEWQLIDYSHVPSIAFNRTKKQFKEHDSERFSQFIESVKQGKTKINVGRLMPYELLAQPSTEVRDLQWKQVVEETRKFYQNVPLTSKFHPANAIHVADVSGSMTCESIPKPIHVALSLAILMAEVGKKPMYTFSASPKRYHPEWETLSQAQATIQDDNYNTDLKQLINRIVGDCMRAGLHSKRPKTRLPDAIFIYTDGGFDQMSKMNPTTAIDYVRKKFGVFNKVPIIVFWNVAGNTQDFAVNTSYSHVLQVAGFSKDMYRAFAQITSAYDISPEAFFRKSVLQERYRPLLEVYKTYMNEVGKLESK